MLKNFVIEKTSRLTNKILIGTTLLREPGITSNSGTGVEHTQIIYECVNKIVVSWLVQS